MTHALHRIGAVVRADLLIRVRRPSSIAVVLILCALAYLVVPPLSSGHTLMQVDGHRALLTSATIALATAGVASVMLGMLGFYLVSNTIRRDAVSRTGFVIAAMPVTNAEYLIGKFLGNAAFLGLVCLGCMINVMGMHLLRAEGPLQPLVYVTTYLAVLGPAVFVISALALLFECVPPLSGRLGDVIYFFVWSFLIAIGAIGPSASGPTWNNFVDVFGMRFMIQAVSPGGMHQAISIGASSYDPTQVPWTFPGIHWTATVIAARFTSMLLAVPLLLVAARFFARFDPAKMKHEVQHAKRDLHAQLNRLLKPVTRVLLTGLSPNAGARAGLARITRCETTLTFMLSPVALAWLVIITVWGTVAPLASVRAVLLPLSFFGILIAIADIATRDATAGMTALLYSMPKVKPWYVGAKFLAAASTALAFVIVPLGRLAVAEPMSALSLFIGVLFVASLAVSLGLLTGSAKTFAGVFLLFLYLALSNKESPGFDFAGWHGAATNGVRLGYLVASIVFLAIAATRQRLQQRG